MHCTILVEPYSQDLKMQECGMQWAVVMRKLVRLHRPRNVMKGLNVQKIDKG